MRYTECRLSRIATEMLRDIDAETVDWTPNYDESREEPQVLPSRSPTSSSTAVRVSRWGWPPISPRITSANHRGRGSAHRRARAEQFRTHALHQRPGFPYRRHHHGQRRHPRGLRDRARPGRGAGPGHTEPIKQGKTAIIVTEIPYQVNKAQLIEKIAELVREKHISEISDLRDESDRSGMRVVIELKREAVPKVVLNKLYKHSAMQTTFGSSCWR